MLQRLQHFFGVTGRLDLVEYFRDFALFVDQECRALDTEVLLAVHALFFPDTVGLRYGVIDVREKRVGEVELTFEFRLLGRGVSRDSEDDRVGSEPRIRIPELTRLRSAARSICFGVEEQDNVFAAGGLEIECLACVGLESNWGAGDPG